MLLVSTAALADDINVPNTFTADTTISSSQMNANFEALVQESNENDSRIANLEASASDTPSVPSWVDSTGLIIGSAFNGLTLQLSHSNRVFTYASFNTITGVCRDAQGDIFFEGSSCSGNAWMALPTSNQSGYGLATGLNGIMFAPDPENPNTQEIQTICQTTQRYTSGCSVRCDCNSSTPTFSPGEALPAVETNLDVNLNATPPLRLEWR